MKLAPRRAARRAAAGVDPPIHSGGCGCCTGFGPTATSLNWKCRPTWLTRGDVHAAISNSMISSVRVPRSDFGTPITANSSSRYPGARPRSSRPPDTASITAASSASRSGWYSGVSSTDVPIRIRVLAATAPSIGITAGR